MKYNFFLTLILVIFITSCTRQHSSQDSSFDYRNNLFPTIAIVKKNDKELFQDKEEFFITCLTKELREKNYQIISDKEFRDRAFPFFEPDETTMNVEPSIDILQEKQFQQQIKTLGVEYIIWVSGQTDYADKVGAVSCALGLQGGGCYGYASQNDESNIQAEIWHVSEKKLLGYNTATAKGKYQLFAFVIPIPIPSDSRQKSCKKISRSIVLKLLEN